MNCPGILGISVVQGEESKKPNHCYSISITEKRNKQINKISNNKQWCFYTVDSTVLELLICVNYSMVLIRSNAEVWLNSFYKYLLSTTNCKAIFWKLGETGKYENCNPCPQGAQCLCRKIRNIGK